MDCYYRTDTGTMPSQSNYVLQLLSERRKHAIDPFAAIRRPYGFDEGGGTGKKKHRDLYQMTLESSDCGEWLL